MKVAAYTIPMYEYRQRNWFEQITCNYIRGRRINKLLFKDYTLHVLCAITLAIVIVGLFIVEWLC